MDLSLDDIIKKNNIKIGSQKQRGRPQNAQIGRRNSASGRISKPLQTKNGRVTKQDRRPLQNRDKSRGYTDKKSGVIDARMKIIQKNRLRLTDARDKLSELAKQTDARTKIKGRNLKVAQQVGGRRDRGRDNRVMSKQPPILLQRSIRNNAANMRDPSSLIRCTINRPMEEFSLRPSTLYVDDVDMPMAVRPHNDLSSIKVVTQNEYTNYNQDYLSSAPESMYMDHYDQHHTFNRQFDSHRGMSQGRGNPRMSLEMRARLDTPPKSAPQYSYPPTRHSPPPSQGHRIVVSNLHSSVTHEDIKELFEDIGPLVTSRLVRPGTAEVIYKLQKDAKKAVEAYHNRQLDGQPMKCLLVNPRSPTGNSGVLRSSNMPLTPKFPSSSKSMVVPDLSAIHKALFTSK